MERSRLRSLLGLILLAVGVLSLSSALMRPFVYAPDMPAIPEMFAVSDGPAIPDVPALPAMPDLPPLPPLPPVPPAPPAPFVFQWLIWLGPTTMILVLATLLVWWLRRGGRARPAA